MQQPRHPLWHTSSLPSSLEAGSGSHRPSEPLLGVRGNLSQPLTGLPKGGNSWACCGGGREGPGWLLPFRARRREGATDGKAALLPRPLLCPRSFLFPLPWHCLASVTRSPSCLLTFPQPLPRVSGPGFSARGSQGKRPEQGARGPELPAWHLKPGNPTSFWKAMQKCLHLAS